jgi:hypothetical protein
MPTHDSARDEKGPAIGVILIGDAYAQARSMIMAMMGKAHEAAAMVADGAIWEGDENILIPPAAKPHALRMAAIWERAAAQFEAGEFPVNRGEPTPSATARA